MQAGKLKKVLKLITLGLSFALIASGIQLLLGGGFSVQGFILRIYLFFFALKIFFCELGAKFMLNLFPYMATFFGKGFFLIFVGVLTIGFVGIGSFSGIIGLAFLICGFGFIILKLLG